MARRRSFLKKFIEPIKDRESNLTRAAAWLALALLLLLLRPQTDDVALPSYQSGQVADQTILAPFTFSITKSLDELERETTEASTRVSPVFRPTEGTQDRASDKIVDLEEAVEEWPSMQDSMLDPEQMITPGFTLSAATLALLSADSTRDETFDATGAVIPDLFSAYIASSQDVQFQAPEFIILERDSAETIISSDSLITVVQARAFLSRLLRDRFPNRELLARAVYEITAPIITATVLLDRDETEIRRSRAAEAISPIKGTLLAGETVVEAHYRVTAEDVEELRSLREAYAARALTGHDVGSLLPTIGHILWTAVFLGLLTGFLAAMAPEVLREPSDLMLLFIIISASVVGSYAVHWFFNFPATAVPLAIVAILATVFFNEQIGFGLTVLVFILAGSHFRFDVSGLIAPLAGSLAAVFRLRQLRKRRDFYLTALWIFMAAVVAGISIGLLAASDLRTLVRIVGFSFANAAVCSIVVMVVLPVLETLFHRATDLRLLELSDMNHVLLRQLALNAPGTYQHSMIVGNLAESACEAIGANALLARVGSYYHDIGKITKPHYFSENQPFGENPHDKLTPKMSALVIASHVKEGLRLAAQERLPQAIRNFVAEHHGSTSISFFYKKLMEQNPDARVDPADFSYPGPMPQSRETAVLMLADASEGAVRSLQEPNASRIRQVVERVINDRMTAGQLDRSNLTFRDLERIRETFVRVLLSVHHLRVKYPEEKKDD